MKMVVKNIFIVFSTLLIIYVLLPSPKFPQKVDASLESIEPADLENGLRKAYYTDKLRRQVIDHYKAEFNKFFIPGFNFPSIRLNYPPETAQTIIRDQTRSTYLEEVVHPMRESLFINGFEPKYDQDVIIVNGKRWYQKVTVKSVSSRWYERLFIALSTIGVFIILYRETIKDFREIKEN